MFQSYEEITGHVALGSFINLGAKLSNEWPNQGNGVQPQPPPPPKDCARFSDCLPGRGPYSRSLFLPLTLPALCLSLLSRFCLSLRRHAASPRQIHIDEEGPSSQTQAQRQRGERKGERKKEAEEAKLRRQERVREHSVLGGRDAEGRQQRVQ